MTTWTSGFFFLPIVSLFYSPCPEVQYHREHSNTPKAQKHSIFRMSAKWIHIVWPISSPNSKALYQVLQATDFKPEITNFFCKEADGKYFRFWVLYSLCHNCSTLLLLHESSHKQYTNGWAWLSSNTTLFIKTDGGWIWPTGYSLPAPSVTAKANLFSKFQLKYYSF